MASMYPFVSKLYSIVRAKSGQIYDATFLNDTENRPFITWSQDGTSFSVWNPTEFSANVLPKYFKHNNFCSFVRQLNIYGFHKLESENWLFAHDEKLFQRDKPELIAKIQRRRQQKRSAPSSDENDDFSTLDAPAPKKLALLKSEETMIKPNFVSIPPTPQTPAANFLPMLSPNSVTSNSSSTTVEEDVAYLKNSNSLLLSEISQMKRKTQTQEDTIAWLIAELARTQRQVESIKQSMPNGNKVAMPVLNSSNHMSVGFSPQTPTPQYQPYQPPMQTNMPAPIRRQAVIPSFDLPHTAPAMMNMSSSSEVPQTNFQDTEFQPVDVYSYDNYYDGSH